MKVEKLSLRNFRNVEDSNFIADPHLNFLVGQNGQGKTSFLEALGYLATLRSFRGAKTEEVLRYNQQRAEISCLVSINGASDKQIDPFRSELKIDFNQGIKSAGKVASINGKPFRSSTQYLSQRFGSFQLGFHTVVFNPSDHDLVRLEPTLRRSYLDRVLSAEDIEYLRVYQKYQRVLQQRNALLKSTDQVPNANQLAGFTEPLVKLGSIIVYARLKWLERLRYRLDNVVNQIAPNQPALQLIYLSNWVPQIHNLSSSSNNLDSVHFAGQEPLPSLEILEQAFWNQLATLRDTELRTRSCLVGPHRDDWAFLIGRQNLKGHGSQGEVRSALLALKLCEIELFRKQTGHRPLLLLDDFSSELDRERRAFLLRFLSLSDLQVFVTSTEESVFEGKRFWVSGGNITHLKES